jgi:hypothetical protein
MLAANATWAVEIATMAIDGFGGATTAISWPSSQDKSKCSLGRHDGRNMAFGARVMIEKSATSCRAGWCSGLLDLNHTRSVKLASVL